jgi:hypothetical protein
MSARSFLQTLSALKARAAVLSGLRHEDKAVTLPVDPLHDDLYLVEFPKSGVTWLCYLMANVNLLLSGDTRQQVTFFNLHTFIPDLQNTPCINAPALPLPGFRIIKTHTPVNPDYFRVFYLVRDPRHVMASYYVFLQSLGWFDGSFEELVEHPDFGIGAWRKHVAGWLDNVPASRSFALLRYEDLLADPAREMTALYKLLGFDISGEIANKAVERSSIGRMRADEAEANARHPINAGMEFVRKGPAGGARTETPDALTKRIEEVAGPLMKRLGYLP